MARREHPSLFRPRRRSGLSARPSAPAWGRVLLVAAGLALLGACGTSGSGEGEPGARPATHPFAQFPDLPVPADARLTVEKTLVFGGINAWFGQLALTSSSAPFENFNFYKQELPRYNWQEVTSIRAPTSVLTYTREDRVLAIQIRPSTFWGSELVLTVSPRESPPRAGAFPPPMAAPAGGAASQPVVRTPLK